MQTISISHKTVSLFPCAVPGAPVIYLNTVAGEGSQIYTAAQSAGCPPFTLAAVSDLIWNQDMPPWDSPAAFKGGEAFTGGADAYLRLLEQEIVPAVESKLPAPPAWRGVAGYSLAGLFALYALYQTDLFSRAASISGSLWFPGFKEYALAHPFKRQPEYIYLSLGEQESKTRNAILQTVEQNTNALYAFYQSKSIAAAFRLNPGNHFSQSTERTAAGIKWLLEQ